jgi:hypothetical protein
MNFDGINFPLYRKYKNNKSYFKIINPRLFEEIQAMGSKKIIKQIEAKQFPEFVFIHDLVFNYEQMAEEIFETDYLWFKGS